MPRLQYNGSITQNIYNGASIKNRNAQWLNFLDSEITWQSNVNPNLIGLKLSDLIKNSLFELSYSVTIIITGNQRYDDSSYPTTDVGLTVGGNIPYNRSYTPSSPGSIGTSTYNIRDNFPVVSYPVAIAVTVRNRCYPGLPGCITYSATNYNFTLVLNIQVVANCTGQNLETQFCKEYCLTNSRECLDDYLNYCLPVNAEIPITASQSCQDFVTNYIQNEGPLSQIDDSLSHYCQYKYKGFGDLFGSDNELDKSLCACHMSAQQYANFEQQLVQLYPGFGNLGLVNECLLPQCASSPYKSVITTAKCNLPQCLNIVSFNNDGTFNDSTVNINQSGQCANIVSNGPKPPGPNPPSPTDKNFWEKYLIWFVVIFIGIFLLILLIFLVSKKRTR